MSLIQPCIAKLIRAISQKANRLRALDILGEHATGDPRVSELLKSLTEKDRHAGVREHAQSHLAELEELEIQ